MSNDPKEIQLPEAFLQETKAMLHDEMPAFIEALQAPSPVSIHMNNKVNLMVDLCDVPWYHDGYYLEQRPQFTLDPLWHAGAYYVQEASSMFLSQFLEQYVANDAVVLDLCAAPGGKSIVASEHLSNGLLVSNEYIRTRSRILAENIIKWGNSNVIVTSNGPESFEALTHLFDAIIVDAPCSGEGMFRKDDNAIAEWSEVNVQNCVKRQHDILSSAWEALKPGGVLIYSTCTYNRKENEEMVQWLIDEYQAEWLSVPMKTEWNITETELGYRFFPHKTHGEGLFMAAVRKSESPRKLPRVKNNKVSIAKERELLQWLNTPERYTLVNRDEQFVAIPSHFLSIYGFLQEKLYILSAGITIAQRKGKDFIPDISLALSKELNKGKAIDVVEVDRLTALSYLQREAITIESEQKGYVLVTYHDIPLGWVKHLGNRSNNLYPDSWRIRMSFSNPLPPLFY